MEGESNSSRTVIRIQGDQQQIEMATSVVNDGANSISSSQVDENIHIDVASSQARRPSLQLLQKDSRQMYLNQCVPLYKAALKGDWEAAKSIIDSDRSILTASIAKGWQTVLHLTAGTEYVQFVEELARMMKEDDLELQDRKGNTALCFAAVSGNVKVAKAMIRKNPSLATIRGGGGRTPLFLAALFGHSEMAWYLYPITEQNCLPRERADIFFTCINTGLYDLALKMLEDDTLLATTRDEDDKTALHLLAESPSAFANQSSRGWTKLFESCFNFRFKRNLNQTKALQLVKTCWEHLLNLGDDEEVMRIIETPSELLFEATKLGNFEFLAVLINSCPDLIWEVSSENWTVIHVAVLYRHGNIFNLVHEIGSIKNIIATYEDADGNNILHLAAKLPPQDRLNVVSGAALQMQQELMWFEKAKKMVQPHYIKKENMEGKTPQELFTLEHKELLREAELWMKDTAKSCMIVSTLIATVVFTAAFNLPGGANDLGTLNVLQNTSFLIFVLSDGATLFSSIVAILMFLSILTSRYSEYDFLKSLPLKLMIGLISLFVSMFSMMIAFSFTFVISYHHGLKWVPFLICIFAFLPIALFALLQYPLLLDTFSSTYGSRILFQPNRQILL